MGWCCASFHSHMLVLAIYLHNGGNIIMGRYICHTDIMLCEVYYVTPGELILKQVRNHYWADTMPDLIPICLFWRYMYIFTAGARL